MRFPLVLTLAALSLFPSYMVAQTRACPVPTTMGAQVADALISVLTSSRPSYVAYAQKMGLAGLAPGSIVPETDANVCTAVSDAIATDLHGSPKSALSNYLVLRAGQRFIALDPTGRVSLVYSVSSAYDDVRVSLK
jgi:hypothetical protein